MFGNANQEIHPWLSSALYSSPFLLIIFTAILKKYLNPEKPNHPPSPPKLPIIGNLHQLRGPSPHKKLQTLSQRHGPLMLLHLGSVPVLVVSSSEAAQQILKTHDAVFSNRPRSSVASEMYDCKDIAFAPYGDYWRYAKSVSIAHLLSSRKIQSFRSIREEEVSLMVEKVRQSCLGKSVVNMGETFACLTNDVISRVALGKKYSDDEGGKRFKVVLERLGGFLGGFDVGEYIPFLSWVKYVNGTRGEFRRIVREIDEFLEFVVAEHEDRSCKGEDDEMDFVDVLLEIQRNGGDGGVALDATSVKALILDMFAAGTDTTYTLLEWTLSELIKNRDAMSKLANELKNVAKHNSTITEGDLEHCEYLKSVVKETLRLHTPLPLLVPREAIQNVRLFDYDVKKGTRVMINAWALGRDPSLWSEPDEFRPERFLESSLDFKGQFRFLPFGAGRRGCPGAAFALGIVELALANLVHRFEFLLVDGVRGEDLDMSEDDGITIHRKFPLRVVVSFKSV